MTRTHVAVQLLRHGPLTLGEFTTITGWKLYRANNVLQRLQRQRKVKPFNDGRRRYYGLATEGASA